ncbi:hypothetical protein Clacol_001318 [Clathrus columnatus]|uniref:Uncharacterized protein n=1 Tax=Clathrus columnatus TaxID=1419009 RepID=A0AAV5A1L3_9AGAM|nr:hypothetical protein Clacol_001318 [Clathrus columnatus]
MSITSSPSKKLITTQHKHEQDVSERVWLRGVLGQTQASTIAIDMITGNADCDTTRAGTEMEMKLELHMSLRNIGSRIRKSVTEGYITPPTFTPNTSPSKQSGGPNPSIGPPLQDQIFKSSRDILCSVYSGSASPDISPRKRGRAAIRLKELDEDDSEEEEEEELDMDCKSMSTRAIKPLPFRLPNSTAALVLNATKPSVTSTTTISEKEEDPFSSPSTMIHNAEAEVMDIDGLLRL